MFERHAAHVDLAVDAVEVFGASLDLHRLQAALLQLALQQGDELLRIRLPLLALDLHHPRDVPIRVRVEGLEREVLQLVAHLVDAQPGGKRRVNVPRLHGYPPALHRLHELDGLHVVQAVG